MKRIPQLDGIRAIAFLLVLMRHLLIVGDSNDIGYEVLWRIQYVGWIGVDLFFVLSGFLICSILWIDKRDKKGLHYFSNFYQNRLLRIWPPYILFLAFYIFIIPYIYGESYQEDVQFIKEHQWYLWSHTANVLIFLEGKLPFNGTILWSLGVEEQFYLLFPFLIYMMKNKQKLTKVLFVIIGVSIIGRVLFVLYISDNVSVLTPFRLEGFLLGAIIALNRENMPEYDKIFKRFAIGSMILLFLIWGWQKFIFYQGLGIKTIGFTCIAIMLAYVVHKSILLRPETTLHRILSHSFLAFIARVSYVGYLIHHPLSWMVNESFGLDKKLKEIGVYPLAVLIYYFILIALTLFISNAIYHLFEKHFLKLKKHHVKQPKGV